MEKLENINNFDTYEPQVLRKAEISRILNSVKQASFNPQEKNNSSNNTSFKKRSLLDIALEVSSSKTSSENNVSVEDQIKDEDKLEEDKINSEQNLEAETTISNEDNFNEESKQQLIEENNALIEQKIKEAEEIAFEKGKQEGLKEGHNIGISEARAQSQEGLDAAISIFRIAAETIDNNDQTNLDIMNDAIQKTIIEIAQQSAGFIIDAFPEKLTDRIREFSKIINENHKKISLDINNEDYDIIKDFIKEDEFFSSINFNQTKDLSRGDMNLNTDGIKVEDIINFGKLKLINELDKSSPEIEPVEENNDAVAETADQSNLETEPVEENNDAVAETAEKSNPETEPVVKDENE